jgi:hypothetical protein
MVNELEVHSRAAQRSNVFLHQFLTDYEKNNKIIYGFVEGHDDPSFYRNFIDNIFPNNEWSVCLYPVGGKQKVLSILKDLNWRIYKKNQIVFFVDRDLQDFLNEKLPSNSNLYVTDFYSIENYIVSSYMFERLIKEAYGFTSISQNELNSLVQLFEDQLNLFTDAMSDLMCHIINWRLNGERPILANLRLNYLFQVKNGNFELKTDRFGQKIDIIAKAEEDLHLSRICLNFSQRKKEFMKSNNYQKFVRGKYLMAFFNMYCRSIHDDYRNISFITLPSIRSARPECDIQLAGPRCRCPDSLSSFLNETIVKYIKSIEKN